MYQIIDAGLKFNGDRPNGGEQKRIDAIVIHHAAGNGSVEDIHKLHLANGWWGIGYHYYIRKDGTIYRGRPEKFVGSHAGSNNDYNSHSIGICFEGNFEVETPTEAQINAGRWLVSDIKSRCEIKEILGHKDLTATACPGKYFPWDWLMAEYIGSTRYAVCIGEYDTEAEAQAVASVLSKMFNAKVIKQ